jgi:hypothetical protein
MRLHHDRDRLLDRLPLTHAHCPLDCLHRRRRVWSLGGLQCNDGDRPGSKHHSNEGENEAVARPERRLLAAREGLLNALLPNVRVNDEHESHERKRNPDPRGQAAPDESLGTSFPAAMLTTKAVRPVPPRGNVRALGRKASPARCVRPDPTGVLISYQGSTAVTPGPTWNGVTPPGTRSCRREPLQSPVGTRRMQAWGSSLVGASPIASRSAQARHGAQS